MSLTGPLPIGAAVPLYHILVVTAAEDIDTRPMPVGIGVAATGRARQLSRELTEQCLAAGMVALISQPHIFSVRPGGEGMAVMERSTGAWICAVAGYRMVWQGVVAVTQAPVTGPDKPVPVHTMVRSAIAADVKGEEVPSGFKVLDTAIYEWLRTAYKHILLRGFGYRIADDEEGGVSPDKEGS